MPRIAGKLVGIEAESPAGSGTYVLVAAGTDHSMTINNSEVETNTKDSGGWRDLAPEGSIKSLGLSGSWVYTEDASHDVLRSIAMAETPSANFRFNLGGNRRVRGEFQVSNYQHQGATEGPATFSSDFSSNGVIVEEGVS